MTVTGRVGTIVSTTGGLSYGPTSLRLSPLAIGASRAASAGTTLPPIIPVADCRNADRGSRNPVRSPRLSCEGYPTRSCLPRSATGTVRLSLSLSIARSFGWGGANRRMRLRWVDGCKGSTMRPPMPVSPLMVAGNRGDAAQIGVAVGVELAMIVTPPMDIRPLPSRAAVIDNAAPAASRFWWRRPTMVCSPNAVRMVVPRAWHMPAGGRMSNGLNGKTPRGRPGRSGF